MNLDDLVNKKFIITISIKQQLEYKTLESCTLDELIDRLPDIDPAIIKLIHGYIHKSNLTTAYNYARQNNVSESYLYKKLKEVKTKYDSLHKEG